MRFFRHIMPVDQGDGKAELDEPGRSAETPIANSRVVYCVEVFAALTVF
jgi:hypothetical protein